MAQKLIKYITKEEFEQVLKAEKKKEFKLAYCLAFGSGLRISEIIGYKGHSKRTNKKTGELIEKDTEVQPLTSNNVDLQAHQIRIIGGKGQKDRITVTSPWLNETNIKLLPLKIKRTTLQGRFQRLALKVLGRKINFNTLRLGFGNYMVNYKNVPLPMVQTLMGHSRIDTTGIYTKANPKQAVDRAWEVF